VEAIGLGRQLSAHLSNHIACPTSFCCSKILKNQLQAFLQQDLLELCHLRCITARQICCHQMYFVCHVIVTCWWHWACMSHDIVISYLFVCHVIVTCWWHWTPARMSRDVVGYGVTTDGVTTFINSSSLNQHYQPVNRPVIFDLPLPPGVTKNWTSSIFHCSSLWSSCDILYHWY